MIFIKKILTGEYEKTAKAAVGLIERIEDKYGFDAGIEAVYCRPSLSISACYYTRDHHRLPGVIRVPRLHPRSTQLRELVFHELGHAIMDHYRVRSYLKHFTRRQSFGWQYTFDTWRFNRMKRKPGFVSGYAALNSEEDFCETLSAYLCSSKRSRSYIAYNQQRIQLETDSRVRRKLRIVRQLLEYQGNWLVSSS